MLKFGFLNIQVPYQYYIVEFSVVTSHSQIVFIFNIFFRESSQTPCMQSKTTLGCPTFVSKPHTAAQNVRVSAMNTGRVKHENTTREDCVSPGN